MAQHWKQLAAGLGRALMLLWLASIAAFAMIWMMPADPAVLTLLAFNQPVTAEAVAALRASWGLDRALPLQYAIWLGGFLAGDWGVSFRSGQPIFGEFAARLPVSLAIGCGGLAAAIAIAMPLAHAAARHPHGAADRLLDGIAFAAQALPAFWVGAVMITLFAVELAWLRPFSGGIERYVLPIVLIAFSALGPLATVARESYREVAMSDYYLAALALGADPRRVLARQGRRYVALALAAAVWAEAGWAIGGTAVIEVVFALPGISQFLVESIALRDYFVLQAYFMVSVAWMAAIATLASATRVLIDPRPPQAR